MSKKLTFKKLNNINFSNGVGVGSLNVFSNELKLKKLNKKAFVRPNLTANEVEKNTTRPAEKSKLGKKISFIKQLKRPISYVVGGAVFNRMITYNYNTFSALIVGAIAVNMTNTLIDKI